MRTRPSALLALIVMPLLGQDPPAEYTYRGAVIKSDGTPADGALVECAGGRSAPVIANSKGEFRVTISEWELRASLDSGPMGWPACRLRASLDGFEPAYSIGRRGINRLVLHPRENPGGGTVSAGSLLAPPKARRAYDKGLAQAKKQRWGRAEKQFREAVELYPDYANAWNALGEVMLENHDISFARECWTRAVAIDPKYLEPSVSLARLAAREEGWAEVWQRSGFVLRINPRQFPEAAFLATLGAFKLERFDRAVEAGRNAVSIGTHERYPQVMVLLGYALARTEAYREALIELHKYLAMMPEAADAEQVRLEVRRLEQRLER